MLSLKYLINFLLIVTFFIACSNEKTSSEPLRLGNTVWPGYEPFYLGKEVGIINSDEVRFVEYTSTSQVLNAFRHGQIDAAALTLYDVLLLADEGLSPKVVLILDVSHGGDVLLSQESITHFQALKGKTIGVEKSAMGLQVLARALEVNHMQANDIKIRTFEGYEHEQAFKNQDIDALVTYEPIRSKLLQNGAHELFTSKEMPNEIVDVLIVREEYLKTHLKPIAELIDKWYRSLAYYQQHPKKSHKIFTRRLNLKEEDIDDVFRGLLIPNKQENLEFFKPSAPSIITISKDIVKLMRTNGYVHSDIKVESLIDYDRSLFIHSDEK